MSVEWNNLDQIGRAEMTGYEAGKRDTEQRIIALLENYRFAPNPPCSETWLGDCYEQEKLFNKGLDMAIALIKGESNV